MHDDMASRKPRMPRNMRRKRAFAFTPLDEARIQS